MTQDFFLKKKQDILLVMKMLLRNELKLITYFNTSGIRYTNSND